MLPVRLDDWQMCSRRRRAAYGRSALVRPLPHLQDGLPHAAPVCAGAAAGREGAALLRADHLRPPPAGAPTQGALPVATAAHTGDAWLGSNVRRCGEGATRVPQHHQQARERDTTRELGAAGAACEQAEQARPAAAGCGAVGRSDGPDARGSCNRWHGLKSGLEVHAQAVGRRASSLLDRPGPN
eukprot:scaffold108166_cov63-Phaeocystis_antarctica.AAC.5